MPIQCGWCKSPNHRSEYCTKAVLGQVPPHPEEVEREYAEPPKCAECRQPLKFGQCINPDCGKAAPQARRPEPVFEAQPRWLGAPLVCTATNRMSFSSVKDIHGYIAKHCPLVSLKRTWECEHCKLWHHEAKPPSPSGDSSGHGRVSELPKNFKPFVRASTRDATAEVERATRAHGAELPVQPPSATTPTPAKATPAKKTLATPRRQAHKSNEGGGLF